MSTATGEATPAFYTYFRVAHKHTHTSPRYIQNLTTNRNENAHTWSYTHIHIYTLQSHPSLIVNPLATFLRIHLPLCTHSRPPRPRPPPPALAHRPTFAPAPRSFWSRSFISILAPSPLPAPLMRTPKRHSISLRQR